ncbi:sensor histidine kinase [Caulobacter sp.]|uniref:sensor histidine kinase n=1 Tax=Caulobacter sp. TaxID=78 RepID=UPI003BAE500A
MVEDADGGRPAPAPTDRALGDAPATSPCEACAVVNEANHRIANHLALLVAHVTLRAKEVGDDDGPLPRREVVFLLDALRGQLDLVARLHRTMAKAGDGAPAPLSASLSAVCDALGGALPSNLVLERAISDDLFVASNCLLALTQIVAEAVTNAVKHALHDRFETIVVAARRHPDGKLVVEVTDDGPGLPAGFEPERSEGLGLRLMHALSKQIGAQLQFESSSAGLTVRVTLSDAATA